MEEDVGGPNLCSWIAHAITVHHGVAEHHANDLQDPLDHIRSAASFDPFASYTSSMGSTSAIGIQLGNWINAIYTSENRVLYQQFFETQSSWDLNKSYVSSYLINSCYISSSAVLAGEFALPFCR